jgi:hypothetical protein
VENQIARFGFSKNPRGALRYPEDYFSVRGIWSSEEFLDRLHRYEFITTELLQIQSLLGVWSEPYHETILTLVPKRLAGRLKIESGLTAWLSLRYYPLLLLLCCGGIAAVASNRYTNLRELMLTTIPDPRDQRQRGPLIRSVARQMNELTD